MDCWTTQFAKGAEGIPRSGIWMAPVCPNRGTGRLFRNSTSQLYVDGELIGGCDIVTEMYQSGELQPLIKEAAAHEEEERTA